MAAGEIEHQLASAPHLMFPSMEFLSALEELPPEPPGDQAARSCAMVATNGTCSI
jgi:hypothetical protein